MNSEYLGLIRFADALSKQSEKYHYVANQKSPGELLGFECEPVITLGVRGGSEDLLADPNSLEALGFELVRVDRGGQATIHNPGQLVIFPVVDVKEFGTKNWVNYLLKVTRLTLRNFGCESTCRDGQPGLYTSNGKIAQIGVRIRQGISTHGVAVNIYNELSDFGLIRACGVSQAQVDQLGGTYRLPDVFAKWVEIFSSELPRELTNSPNFQSLESSRARL